jgi:hypothetical protein
MNTMIAANLADEKESRSTNKENIRTNFLLISVDALRVFQRNRTSRFGGIRRIDTLNTKQ